MTGESAAAPLTDVYVARLAASVTPGAADGPDRAARADCFRLHRVEWQESRPSDDGTHLVCRFRAPDAESVRLALRMSGIAFEAVWACEAGPPDPDSS